MQRTSANFTEAWQIVPNVTAPNPREDPIIARLHALATGLLIFALYFAIDCLGLLESRSRLGRFLILVPTYFIALLLFNLIWPFDP